MATSLPKGAAQPSTEHLLFRFREKDSPTGVTRETVRKLAAHFDMTETAIIHLALRGLANDVWPIKELEGADEAMSEAERLAYPAANPASIGRIRLPADTDE